MTEKKITRKEILTTDVSFEDKEIFKDTKLGNIFEKKEPINVIIEDHALRLKIIFRVLFTNKDEETFLTNISFSTYEMDDEINKVEYETYVMEYTGFKKISAFSKSSLNKRSFNKFDRKIISLLYTEFPKKILNKIKEEKIKKIKKQRAKDKI